MLSDVSLGIQHVSESERAGRRAQEREAARSRLRGHTLLVRASKGSRGGGNASTTAVTNLGKAREFIPVGAHVLP